jgi:hypothetical protein
LFLVFVKKSRDLTWLELKSSTRVAQAKKRKKSPFICGVPELDFGQSFSTIRTWCSLRSKVTFITTSFAGFLQAE